MASTQQNCSHCGKRLKRPDAAFCTNCGSPLSAKAREIQATVHGGSLAKIVVHIPGEETREEFLSKATTTIGRSQESMIRILSPIVSGRHAKIDLVRTGHMLTDLNSTNGTFVNGQRLKPGEPYPLATHDIIRFADSLGNSTSLTYVAPSGFSEILDMDFSTPLALTDTISYIGRNPETAITLNHPAVSWYHAKVIQRASDRYTIQDLSSQNGTFINGSQLRQRRETELTRGDVIQIGPFNLVYQGEGRFAPFSAERNFRLEAVALQKIVYPTNFLGSKDKSQPKAILSDFDLVINPREFVALVGGSGTGKSTLMKALSGVSPATSGMVLVNGDDLYANFNLYRSMIGYVPQDDIIHTGLEVRSALRYAAQLRLPDLNDKEVAGRIEAVLAKVGMRAQANMLIRDLSGGQRKRVNIAVELLAEPWIFFLDEPTSGLDPGLEKLMMDTLRQLADEGRTIVLVTHATRNILDNCDQVVFMARGGQLAYFGPPDQVTHFFDVDDFADVYTRLAQTIGPGSPTSPPAKIKAAYTQAARQQSEPAVDLPAGPLWVSAYRQSPLYQTYIANRQSGEMARPIAAQKSRTAFELRDQLRQIGVLGRRYLDLIRHDRLSLAVLLAVMPLLGLLLLLISDGSALVGHPPNEIDAFLAEDGIYTIANQAQTLLFMMALAANLLGVFAAAYEIIKERIIYRRERLVNLKILPYYASKFGVLAIFMLLQCLLLLLVLATNIDFPSTGVIMWAPLEYYFTLVFTALASVALGLFISSLATSTNIVTYLILLALFVQIVFSGAIFELSPLTEPLSWLTLTRWSLEALGGTTDIDSLNALGQLRVEREIDIGRSIQTVVEDVPAEVDIYVYYAANAPGLLSRWIFLWAHTLVWSGLTVWLLKRQDEI